MSVIGQFALKSLRANKVRTVVSVVGIALACALVTAIFSSVATVQASLTQSVLITNGSWEVSFSNLSDAGAKRIVSDNKNTESALVRHYGVANLGEGSTGYLAVTSLPVDETEKGMLPMPKLTSGRMPETSSEIILPDTLRGIPTPQVLAFDASVSAPDGFRVGGTLVADLGQRRSLVHGSVGGVALADDAWPTYDANGTLDEEVVDARTATFTIVGFYNASSYWWSSVVGWDGLTVDDGKLAPRSSSAYVITDPDAPYEELQAYADEVVAESGPLDSAGDLRVTCALNDSLLDMQNRLEDGGIWSYATNLAVLLVIVVLVAAIALIYNSFAISITERTRQFGLLSSLGASRKQLRRCVLTEAVLLSAVGIPAGTALGVLGAHLVFTLNGVGLEAWLSANPGAIAGAVVSPAIIVAACGVTLLTIAVSAALPAWRASRTSAVEAIRSTRDLRRMRIGRRSRGIRKLFDQASLRIEGVPGLVARRNLAHGGARSRVAVLSLGLSVTLVLTAGMLTSLVAFFTHPSEADSVDVSVTAWRTLADGEDVSDAFADVERLEKRLAEMPDVSSLGFTSTIDFLGSADAGLLNSADATRLALDAGSDGSGVGQFQLVFLSNAAWCRYVSACGLPEGEYCDGRHPLAIALNGTTAADDSYDTLLPFAEKGKVTLYTEIGASTGRKLDGLCLRDGTAQVRYASVGGATTDGIASGETSYEPASRAVLASYDLPVGATTTVVPDIASSLRSATRPVLLLPASAIDVLAATTDGVRQELSPENGVLCAPLDPATLGSSGLVANVALSAPDSADATTAINGMLLSEYSQGPLSASALDLATSMQMYQLVASAIQAFIGGFAVVCTIIAIANVFNTISTAMCLRRGEHAVLRSAGMGERDFRRMLTRECASFALRGLLLGAGLAAVVMYVLYGALAFTPEYFLTFLPPVWIVAAVALVLAVLVVSVLYALGNDRNASIVETLRENAC